MISLTKYRQFWEEKVKEGDMIDSALPVAIDKDMAKKIQSLGKDSVTLFVLPPMTSISGTSIDAMRFADSCVLFVMKRYDPMRTTAFEVLEQTQSSAIDVAGILMGDFGLACSPWKVDTSSIDLMPETEFFAGFAGWSIGFKIIL